MDCTTQRWVSRHRSGRSGERRGRATPGTADWKWQRPKTGREDEEAVPSRTYVSRVFDAWISHSGRPSGRPASINHRNHGLSCPAGRTQWPIRSATSQRRFNDVGVLKHAPASMDERLVGTSEPRQPPISSYYGRPMSSSIATSPSMPISIGPLKLHPVTAQCR